MKYIASLLIVSLTTASSIFCSQDLHNYSFLTNTVEETLELIGKQRQTTSFQPIHNLDHPKNVLERRRKSIPSPNTLKPISELVYAYAIVPSEDRSPFPTCGQVDFTQLISLSGNVSLCRGGVKLPKGTYRITYTAQLQNSGGVDVMQLWLTSKASQSKKAKLISASSVQVGIDEASDNPSNFQVIRELLLKVKKPSFIRLNYSTSGNAILSSIPSADDSSAPLPFYLMAIKVGGN